MRVRYNQGVPRWWDKEDLCEYLKPTTAPIRMIIDPSKSNLAGLLVTTGKVVILEFELSGNDKKFFDKAMDTTDYCERLEEFFKAVRELVNLDQIFIEQHILSKGNDHYHSMTTLTEIRSKIVGLAKELTGQKAIEVNNMAWKGAVLPDGYRGHSEKGSHRYLSEINPKFRSYTDDMTDCYCIMEFSFKRYPPNHIILCDAIEAPITSVNIKILDELLLRDKGFTEFKYNSAFTPEQNATYYLNRSSNPGYCAFPPMDIRSMYKYGEVITPGSSIVMLVYK